MEFDFKMIDGFNQLYARNWQLKFWYFSHGIYVLKWIKQVGKNFLTLDVWDTYNYARMKVEQIGKSLNLYKLKIDFNTAKKSELLIYCRRDTEIIYQFIKKLCTFIQEHELGKLKSTAGSLAMNIFKTKFYKQDDLPIYVHNKERAILIERDSYRGGICDVFNLNKAENMYKLDINSMYPEIMKNKNLPTKLEGYLHKDLSFKDLTGKIMNSQKALFKIYNQAKKEGKHCIINGLFQLPKEYAYILNTFDKSMFCYGKNILMTCCQPELDFIEQYGSIDCIYQLTVYSTYNYLKDFVDFFYEKRLQYKKDQNKVYEQFCKLIMNNLYGKFAQREIKKDLMTLEHKTVIENQEVLKEMIKRKLDLIKQHYIVYLGTISTVGEFWVIENQIFCIRQTQENSVESFVAISSFITSNARMLLIKYLLIAKRENVYYCDTDSLFTTELGYVLLKDANLIDDTELGKLKVEGIGTMKAYNPKFYDFNDIKKRKGIKHNSKLLENSEKELVYQNEIWDKLKTDLRTGNFNVQHIKIDKKKMKKEYTKGNIINGIVEPFHISEISCKI